uniref:Uncharacterized protein n=1 Tax=Panagrolaimus sp. PS1159 TaxID=55785 RepID=A0AC35GRH4_9BILA
MSETQQIDENNNYVRNETNDDNFVPHRTPISANVRFTVALGVLITLGLSICVCQGLLYPSATFYHFFAAAFIIFITFFCFEWIRIHSTALTRQKRAFFDESNILETYQPRSRTHGHLFVPDPPTPGPVVKFNDDKNAPERSTNEKAAFNAMRDAHYENMFEHAARVAKEAEESDRQALEAQKARLSSQNKNNEADSNILPKGEQLYEDLPTNPPINGPSDTIIGTKLELPPSLMEKSEESDNGGGKAKKAKSPKQKSSKTKG